MWKKGEEMAKEQKAASVAGRILDIGYQGTVGFYYLLINRWKGMWTGMTLAQKIGWTLGLLAFLAYPIIVWVHFVFLRKTF